MPRPRKPAEQHRLEGTYRGDRHGGGVENYIGNYLEIPEKIEPPENITDKYCREHYKYHVNLLMRLKILTLSDIPEIDMMYESLQQYRKIGAVLSKLNPLSEEYEKLSRLLLKFGNRFSEIAVKYCVSPGARNRIRIEALSIRKETEHQASATAKLLRRKKM
jgi:hypothetical protein